MMMMIVMMMMMMMMINACSWVRDARLFNNKYYKLMAGTPDRQTCERCLTMFYNIPKPLLQYSFL